MVESLVNLFFPKVCMGCNSFLLNNEITICTVCRHEIPLTNHHLNEENEAKMKFYGKIPVEFVATFLYFNKKGIVQELIHNLKYRGHQEIGTALGSWFVEDLKNNKIIQTVDEVIPVPLHKKRLKNRGYNQVTTFAKTISKNLEIPYNSGILSRNIYSTTQVYKNLLGRTSVSSATFGVTFSEKDHNKHFLLVDDVLTTGATLEACARELLKISGAKVSIVCMAMSH